MFKLTRVKYQDPFIRVAQNSSIGVATNCSWMNEELFVQYLEHVIRQTRCTKDHKILLILDNQDSHSSLADVDLAKRNGVVILKIPPNNINCNRWTEHATSPSKLHTAGHSTVG